VDFGTTATVVAVADGGNEPLLSQWGRDGNRFPSAVYLDSTGLLTGAQAIRSAARDPMRFEATPKRELSAGQSSLILGGTKVGVDALVTAVIKAATSNAGDHDGRTWVATHPAKWSSRQTGVLSSAFSANGLGPPVLVPEPVAAAWAVVPPAERVAGARHAIFDWGGGTFDVAVVVWDGVSFEVLASHGVDPLGGEDVDAALYADVLDQLDASTRDRIGRGSEHGDLRDRYQLHEDVRLAKEALSSDSQTPVWAGTESVVVTRDRLDDLAGPFVDQCIDALRTCLTQAEVRPDDLAGLHLTGDASRMPLVGSRLRAFTGMDLRLPPDPKAVVALGAVAYTRSILDNGAGTKPPPPEPEPVGQRQSEGRRGGEHVAPERIGRPADPNEPTPLEVPSPLLIQIHAEAFLLSASTIVVPERRLQLTRDVDTNARYARPDGTVATYQVLSQSDGHAGATPALITKWRDEFVALGWGPSQEQQLQVDGLPAVTWRVTRPNQESSTPDQIVVTAVAGWTTSIMISGAQAARPAPMWQSVRVDVGDKDWLRHRLLPKALPPGFVLTDQLVTAKLLLDGNVIASISVFDADEFKHLPPRDAAVRYLAQFAGAAEAAALPQRAEPVGLLGGGESFAGVYASDQSAGWMEHRRLVDGTDLLGLVARLRARPSGRIVKSRPDPVTELRPLLHFTRVVP
jgi:actin-like ATPase involved in cell morphogenesis